MPQSESLNKDIIKTLDIFARRFVISSSKRSKESGTAIEVSVCPADLQREKLDYDSFCEALYELGKTISVFKIKMIHRDDYMSLDTETGEDPTILDVVLPNNFNEIVKKIKKQYHLEKNEALSYDSISDIEVKITYKLSIGRLIFNTKDKVTLEGKQRDVVGVLVDHGNEIKVSWDEIYDSFKDTVDDVKIDAKKRSVSTAVNAINDSTRIFLKQGKDLIDRKDNEYWLQYEVEKDEVDKGR